MVDLERFELSTSALSTQAFDAILIEFERFCSVWLQLSPVTVSDRYVDAFCGRTPKSCASSTLYSDYNPERLKAMKMQNSRHNLKLISA
jgi:hypothetical protein